MGVTAATDPRQNDAAQRQPDHQIQPENEIEGDRRFTDTVPLHENEVVLLELVPLRG